MMKTTVDIPDRDLADAIRFTKAKSTREAIATAIHEFDRRRRLAEFTKHAGTFDLCEASMNCCDNVGRAESKAKS